MATQKVKQSYELKLLAGFADEDDRTITLINPKRNLTAAQINAVGELAVGVLIGDKYGAAFTRFKEAYYREGTVTTLDFA